MKRYLSILTLSLAGVVAGSLSSCQDEDFDVSTETLKEKAFEHGFVKEFGQPSANQSWDFYSQQMQAIRQEAGLTRATQAITVTTDSTIRQPTDQYFTNTVNTIGYALEEGHDNHTVGQNSYTLTSTGEFKIYAVEYAGGIETNSTYRLDFGIAYIDPDDNQEKRVHLFRYGFRQGYSGSGTYGFGNPGWAVDVNIPKGVQFYFYMKYSYPFGGNYGRKAQMFYSNQSPRFLCRDNTYQEYPEYGGMSTLLYSTEHIDPETGEDVQIMMIGIEDAWGQGTPGTQFTLDLDFNDIVLFIEGELPVPSSKRFFAEDKSQYDWDYNDVVFDVSNNGIVLRAVGGTLPVWLDVTDRTGETTTYGELHELMRSLQGPEHINDELTFKRVVDGKEETFYKPIDVASYESTGLEGLWFDPVNIAVWTSLGTQTVNTRLEEGEVERFANPLAEEKVGDLRLVVGSKYGQTYDEAVELATLGSDANDKQRPAIITIPKIGSIPAIWSAPTSVRWMKEMKKITLGYEDFYGGGTAVDGMPQWWEENRHPDLWYVFDGDKNE